LPSDVHSKQIQFGPLRSATLVERKAEEGTETTLMARVAVKGGKVDDQLGVEVE
jgi:hypothetical protein